MKKLTLIMLLLSVAAVKAQNFEGIITWKFVLEITDPKAKAEMEAAQKKMSDPETQAQMKAMQAQMNDPQMKAMMEANPQMKKQMEAALKMAQGGDLNSMMPKGMSTKIKNQNVVTTMDGGFMGNMEMLYLKDKNTSYRIDREAKTYSVVPQSTTEDPNKKKMEVKVTKTSETAKILDYPCTKYIVDVTTSEGNTMKQFFWTTTAIKDLDFKSMANQRMGGNNQALMYYEKLEGVPLKVEMPNPQGRMLMEVTELKKQTLSSADFAIPAGFKETKSPY